MIKIILAFLLGILLGYTVGVKVYHDSLVRNGIAEYWVDPTTCKTYLIFKHINEDGRYQYLKVGEN